MRKYVFKATIDNENDLGDTEHDDFLDEPLSEEVDEDSGEEATDVLDENNWEDVAYFVAEDEITDLVEPDDKDELKDPDGTKAILQGIINNGLTEKEVSELLGNYDFDIFSFDNLDQGQQKEFAQIFNDTFKNLAQHALDYINEAPAEPA